MFGESKRFHVYHGSNVTLSSDNMVALRMRSYANALVFSESPLEPNDLFMLEIDKTERGWTGDMRIGLTSLNPHQAQITGLELPEYALPDLSFIRPSWIYAISEACSLNTPDLPDLFIDTRHGCIPLSTIVPPTNETFVTEVGSQIGLLYVPITDTHAELHFIINGKDQGAFASDVPYSDEPLYVVVDVYGCTKSVRIVKTCFGVKSLQDMCTDTILKRIKHKSVGKLPLPKALKDYLRKRTNGKTIA